MTKTAIIGGTGFDQLSDFSINTKKLYRTPYGQPSALLVSGTLNGKEFLFLPRHGSGHTIPPHRINYRANIYALKEAGASQVIAFAAVGAINPSMLPCDLVIPDQLIDYTWGREHTFFDGEQGGLDHIEFANPYTETLRERIIRAASQAGISAHNGGTYAVTQGPRLETAAEVDRLERDGADIIGMTGMPEAALARELGMEYAAVAIVVNPAAGRSAEPISMEMILSSLADGRKRALAVIGRF